MKTVKFDTIIAMNLLGLGVISSGYAANLMVNDIPAMTQTMNQKLPEARFVDYTEKEMLEELALESMGEACDDLTLDECVELAQQEKI